MLKNFEILYQENQNIQKTEQTFFIPKQQRTVHFIYSSQNPLQCKNSPLSQIQNMFSNDLQYSNNACQTCKLTYIKNQVAIINNKSKQLLKLNIDEQQNEAQCNKTLIFQLKYQKFDIKQCGHYSPISMEEIVDQNFKICFQNSNKNQCQCQYIQNVLQKGLIKLQRLQSKKKQIQDSKRIVQKECEKQMMDNQCLRNLINQIKMQKEKETIQIQSQLFAIKQEIQNISNQKDNDMWIRSQIKVKQKSEIRLSNVTFDKMTNLIYM